MASKPTRTQIFAHRSKVNGTPCIARRDRCRSVRCWLRLLYHWDDLRCITGERPNRWHGSFNLEFGSLTLVGWPAVACLFNGRCMSTPRFSPTSKSTSLLLQEQTTLDEDFSPGTNVVVGFNGPGPQRIGLRSSGECKHFTLASWHVFQLGLRKRKPSEASLPTARIWAGLLMLLVWVHYLLFCWASHLFLASIIRVDTFKSEYVDNIQLSWKHLQGVLLYASNLKPATVDKYFAKALENQISSKPFCLCCLPLLIV